MKKAAPQYIWLYIPCPTKEKAKEIARVLVNESWIACANIIDNVHSIYQWQGKVEESSEIIMIAKTKSELYDQVKNRIEELHPYECPCIVALPIDRANERYTAWIDSVTK